jgi:protein TonB
VTTDDYPTADIRAGHTGTVRFRVGIDASGRVTDCTVTQSSGYAGLDAATCRNVTRRARFDAASDAMGEKVAGTYDGTIRWVIPQD